MNIELIGLSVAVGVVVMFLIGYIVKLTISNNSYKEKFSKIINIEEESEQLGTELSRLKEDFKSKKSIYDSLIKQIAIYDDEIELAELGFYKRMFPFDTSEKFKGEIKKVRDKQKEIIASKKAIYTEIEWTVEGSKAKGKTFANRIIRLTSRAFNNECDSAIANVKWNNVDKMRLRIEKAWEAINKMNETNSVVIDYSYLKLKIDELRLTYEYQDKKQKEKEEQAEIRQLMREEAKLEQEKDKAEKEEEKYQKLFDKANKDAEKLSGDKLVALNLKLKELELELEAAKQKSMRAKSMAEQTRSGHVYVISNIGSFGENVYKIGMTRRLEPIDRVKELGDASVPFIFDVHAMIYSEDAPSLEKSLHKIFDRQRVNLVNSRKEFFNITLLEIEDEVKKISPNIEFIQTIEARDYKESIAIREKDNNSNSIDKLQKEFPTEL